MGSGFLGNDASFMLDFVVVALIAVVPLIVWSLLEVKVRRNYLRHRNLQLLLGIVLLVTVAAFEIDMRMQGGWLQIINKDPASPRRTPQEIETIRAFLYVHLIFAISTPVLWATTLILAFKRFASPPAPSAHSRLHSRLGWLSTADIVLTSVTGLAFYYVAFVR
jgi:putative membrane protein